jgi:hypothetical protein
MITDSFLKQFNSFTEKYSNPLLVRGQRSLNVVLMSLDTSFVQDSLTKKAHEWKVWPQLLDPITER